MHYTFIMECLFLVCLAVVATPITANLPSRNGANICVFPGVTTMVCIGTCNGFVNASFNLTKKECAPISFFFYFNYFDESKCG